MYYVYLQIREVASAEWQLIQTWQGILRALPSRRMDNLNREIDTSSVFAANGSDMIGHDR